MGSGAKTEKNDHQDPGTQVVTVEITSDNGHTHHDPEGRPVEYKKGDRFPCLRHYAESIERLKAGKIVG